MSLIPRGTFFDPDRFVNDFWAPAGRDTEAAGSFFAPRVDIKENDDHYEITAELPGVKKADIHVTLVDGVLTLQAETKQEEKEEKEGKLIRQERRYGKFMRSFDMGGGVSEENISAEFKDGVLLLKAPKMVEPEHLQRRINID